MAVESGRARFALGTFSYAGCAPFAGLVLDPGGGAERVVAVEGLRALGAEFSVLGQGAGMLDLLARWDSVLPVLQAAADRYAGVPDGREAPVPVPIAELRVHAPVRSPQVYMSGANYFKHVVDLIVDQGPGANPDTEGMDPTRLRAYAEALMRKRQKEGVPYIFTKPASAISGPFDTLEVPAWAERPDWELELAVVIGRPAHRVGRAEALAHVAGYTIANDITNRDWVYARADMKALGTDWLRAKGLPGYLPTGPFLVPAVHAGDPRDLRITLKLNGETKQDESTADMIFDVARLVEHVSQLVRLAPGDMICTGSPAGNGTHTNRFLRTGDLMEATITGLGTQRVPVIQERS